MAKGRDQTTGQGAGGLADWGTPGGGGGGGGGGGKGWGVDYWVRAGERIGGCLKVGVGVAAIGGDDGWAGIAGTVAAIGGTRRQWWEPPPVDLGHPCNLTV